MNPRLVVTREQAETWLTLVREGKSASVGLPERPTMPCPERCFPPGSHIVGWAGHDQYEDCSCRDDTPGTVPIPEGTRVDVGYPCECAEHGPGMRVNTHTCPTWRTGGLVLVATATLAGVELSDDVHRLDPASRERPPWVATLTDVEAV